jgi:hypothetical protein
MSIFKSTFVKEVREQLDVRQKAITTRDSKQLYQLNSRNAWIKMTSSVNVLDGTTFTNSLANKYILQGGILLEGKLTPGGIGNSYTPYSNSRGIRPMPGIISVDIKSKSAYGSLREATISFSCNSIEQLEDLELLYMRPGYTVLLEWGWLPYLDNNGKLQTNLIDVNKSVISGSFSTMTEVFDDLFQRSKRLNGNYDAIFGKVSNYNWTARPDGGYDCQTTLISIGEVIESLKVNSVPLDVKNIAKSKGILKINPGISQQVLEDSYSLNKLSGLLTELETFAEVELKKVDNDKGTTAYAGFVEPEGEKYDLLSMRIAASKEGTSVDNLESSTVKSFITLESLVKLLNKHVILAVAKEGNKLFQPLASISVESNPKFYDSDTNTSTLTTSRTVNVPTLSSLYNVQPAYSSVSVKPTVNLTQTSSFTSNALRCLAHPYQVSVDIDTCIITNDIWAKGDISVAGIKAAPSAAASGKINIIDPKVFAGSSADILNYLKAFAEAAGRTTPSDATYQQFLTDFYNKVFKIPAGKFETLTLAANSLAVAALNAAGNTTNITIVPGANLPLTKTVLPFSEISSKISTISAGLTNKLPIEFVAFLNSVDDASAQVKAQQTEQKAEIKVPLVGYLKLLNTTNQANLKTFQIPGDDQLGITGNIYVNINMLQRLVNSNNVGSEKREIQLYSFLKTVMSKIQESIGNVNNFDIHVDPAEGNVGRIIDINLTIPINERKNLANFAFEIPIGTVGPDMGSIVRSYNIQSQIFPNQSSLIAIGSQVKNGGEQGTQNYTLLSFNRNIQDRNLPAKIDPKNTDKEPTPEEIKESILKPNLSILNEYLFPQQAQVKIDKNGVEIIGETGKYKNALRDIISYAQGISKSPIRTSSIIPIQLSLTLDGIGGIIIGNVFKIPDTALPKGYKFELGSTSKLAQTVIGLSHKIENNDWTTTIDAYNIILDSETPDVTILPEPPKEVPPPTPSNRGNRTIPDPPLAPNGLRYPFDGRFSFVRGIQGGAHGGVDLAIPVGTSLYAVDDGIVINVTDGAVGNPKPEGGTQVIISHSSGPLAGKITIYSHLSRRDLNIRAKITKGTLIGLSGTTGRSDGPHLHFEVQGDDPSKYFPLFS